ncbi:uncharacterized protein LOC126298304 [Schistocerca gregaria]|uniref:uncharacterized protein LOC126298304 n=1 Tax=Schistocerca gregaria TaxID=7010 RepID=UPI00211EF9F1|nr:uncharacterized protein LOC126298304 [Schistocerca gregaria]
MECGRLWVPFALWLGLRLLALPAHALLSAADARFVADFFADKNVRIVALHTCSDVDSRRLSKQLLSAYNVWVVQLNKDYGHNTSNRMIPVDYYKTGLFVDYTCLDGKLFLNQSEQVGSGLWSLVWSREAPRSLPGRLRLPLSPASLVGRPR